MAWNKKSYSSLTLEEKKASWSKFSDKMKLKAEQNKHYEENRKAMKEHEHPYWSGDHS